MSDNSALKMNEAQAELEKAKEEMKEIQKQNNELKNEIVFKNLIENENGIQSKVDVPLTSFKGIQQTVTALSNREKQTILLLSGWDQIKEDSLLMLENDEQDWKQLNIKLPYPINNYGAQFLNSNLYIFGGENKRDEVLNLTYKLSKSLQWEKMTDMNQKCCGISNSNVILNNQIWVCGGHDGKEGLKSVKMYDPKRNEWKYMKEMNEIRKDAAAAVVNEKIFCSGGVWADSVECYDPSSDVWTIICDMPKGIYQHGAVEIDGYLIVMGGENYGKYLENVWALETTDRNAVWIEKTSMLIPRSDLSIANVDDKVFVCGGYNGEYLDDVEIFNGEVWKNGPKMPTSRWFAPAVVVPIEFAKKLEQFIGDSLESSGDSDGF